MLSSQFSSEPWVGKLLVQIQMVLKRCAARHKAESGCWVFLQRRDSKKQVEEKPLFYPYLGKRKCSAGTALDLCLTVPDSLHSLSIHCYLVTYTCCSTHFSLSFFSFFKWIYWLIKSHRFQVHNSITHHLYIVLCVHHPQSSLLSSPFIPLIPSSSSPYPLSL